MERKVALILVVTWIIFTGAPSPRIIPTGRLRFRFLTPPGQARMWGPELSRRSLRKILENPSLLSTRPVPAVRSAGRNWPIRSLTDTISV